MDKILAWPCLWCHMHIRQNYSIFSLMQIAKLAHRKWVSSWIYFHSRAEDFFTTSTCLQDPRQLQGYLVRRSEMHSRSLRDNILLHVIKTKTKMGQSSFKCAASKDWNELPQELRRVQFLSNFKTKVFKYLLNMDKKEHICSVK
jgi:hypothetical protein